MISRTSQNPLHGRSTYTSYKHVCIVCVHIYINDMYIYIYTILICIYISLSVYVCVYYSLDVCMYREFGNEGRQGTVLKLVTKRP